MMRSKMRILLLGAGVLLSGFAGGLTSAFAQDTEKRVWTVDELLTESSTGRPRLPIDYCQRAPFKPCVCHYDVKKQMRYRPAVKECGGNAAVILSGSYLGVFSVVVRDNQNRDRWPISGFNGCSAEEAGGEAPPNECSAFKVQKRFKIGSGRTRAEVHCLGDSGYSKLFSRVVRVTAKLADVPGSNSDPLVRWCLKQPDAPLN